MGSDAVATPRARSGAPSRWQYVGAHSVELVRICGRGEADLILAKHRNGPTGVVAVAFQGRYSRFTDLPQ